MYGADDHLRHALSTRQLRYVLGVTSTHALWVWDQGAPQQRSIRAGVQQGTADGWTRLRAGHGATGPRVDEWA